MRAYVIRRILLLIPTFLLLSILVFLSVRFIPGDAVDALMAQMQWMGGGDIDHAAFERMLGLDRPIYVQYGRWLGGIFLHGTLGDSLLGAWRVEEKIVARLPATLELGVMAIVIGLLIGLLIGLPVGIYSAMRRNTAADYVGRSVAIIGLATPNFWLATLVLTFPALRSAQSSKTRPRSNWRATAAAAAHDIVDPRQRWFMLSWHGGRLSAETQCGTHVRLRRGQAAHRPLAGQVGRRTR